MTDDDKLAALFRDAAGTPPPSGFGHGDVTAASRRITVRRRAVLVTGAVVLVAVAGIGSAVVLPHNAGTATSAAAGAAAPRADSPEGAPGDAARQAQAAAPVASDACANRQDPALRALLDQALPEVAGAPAAATADVCPTGGERHVSVEVTDGGATGILSVSVLPAGTAPSLPPGDYRSAPTASGATVIVGSTAVGGGPAPYASRLAGLLAELAPRL